MYDGPFDTILAVSQHVLASPPGFPASSHASGLSYEVANEKDAQIHSPICSVFWSRQKLFQTTLLFPTCSLCGVLKDMFKDLSWESNYTHFSLLPVSVGKVFQNTRVCSQLSLNKEAFSGLWMHYSPHCVNCPASGHNSVSQRKQRQETPPPNLMTSEHHSHSSFI